MMDHGYQNVSRELRKYISNLYDDKTDVYLQGYRARKLELKMNMRPHFHYFHSSCYDSFDTLFEKAFIGNLQRSVLDAYLGSLPKDDTVAAIEYKGAHLISADDAKEKDMVGRLWAEKSQGCCRFLMATKRDEKGRDLSIQIKELLA